MKINKLLLSASFALCAAFAANAQVVEEEVTEYSFQPHWYIQGQVGMQETLGETSFGRLASFNAQIGVGYRFNPVLGARLVFNGLTSKGSMTVFEERSDWKWNYIAPTANLTVDLTNLFGGYNPERIVSAGIFGGVGANIAWKNDEANTVNTAFTNKLYAEQPAAERPNALQYIWSGTKARFVGQFGAFLDFNLTSNLKLGLELQANVLPDGYNSKKAHNADWYFNGLVGVKYAFGTTFTKTKRAVVVAQETNVVERVVEVPVEKIVVKEIIKEVPAPLTRDVFFKISTYKVTKDEMYKVAEVARYMKQHPDTKVTVSGYADKGTGTLAINLRLAAQRAEAVVDALVKEFGIPADRITAKSMGEVEDQPYDTPAHNRVAICIVE